MMRLFLQEWAAKFQHIPSWRKSFWRTKCNRRSSHSMTSLNVSYVLLCHSERPQGAKDLPDY
jgi:hypothetical protein